MLSGSSEAFNQADHLPRQVFYELHRQIVPVENYMANQIVSHSPNIQKRGLFGDLKKKVQSYIQRTYTNKALASFEGPMNAEINRGLAQYYRYTKRDTMLTQEQIQNRQLQFSNWLGKRLDAKLKNHMMQGFIEWKNAHNPVNRVINKVKQTVGMQKRFLGLEPSKKNNFIIEVVAAFLTIPLFANPFTAGIWGAIFSVAFGMFFIRWILNRVVYGRYAIFGIGPTAF